MIFGFATITAAHLALCPSFGTTFSVGFRALIHDALSTKKTPLKNISGVLSGDDRARTDNLLRARQALSQLSYVPNMSFSAPLGDA